MIQLFYGSDTNKTHRVVQEVMRPLFDEHGVSICDKVVSELKPEDWTENEVFIIGVPTWYYGELQSDWQAYFEELKGVDFTGKTIAIFGLGDQWGYDEWFIDGVGILAEVLIQNGAKMIAPWPTEGYDYTASKALNAEGDFYGLALDEDNQYELTDERCKKWVEMVVNELHLTEKSLSNSKKAEAAE